MHRLPDYCPCKALPLSKEEILFGCVFTIQLWRKRKRGVLPELVFITANNRDSTTTAALLFPSLSPFISGAEIKRAGLPHWRRSQAFRLGEPLRSQISLGGSCRWLCTMIRSLLHALMLGIVTSQQADTTKKERSTSVMNQTFSVFANDNSTTKLNNATSRLFNETIDIEEKLQGNRTSGLITEDDERFQDDQNQASAENCKRDLLVRLSHEYCGQHFHEEMLAIGTENWCVLDDVIRPYNDLTVCVEQVAGIVNCFFPNPDIQDFFVYIHSMYFENCPEEDVQFEDAPHSLVVALTVIPVCLIPILVYLVVWKS
ncbi:uncharacterized protein PAE49_000569 [Odontesthes bonariensis]|uniref:uncharacterized protein LOC142373492 n=1 Tax=Odontesthes bonariensis TaxID=219752 RepID=UPI003F5840AA